MFGKLGDIAGMMKQAKEMQNKMEAVQKTLANTEVKGSSNCGTVEAVATCDLLLKHIKISNECLATENQEIIEEKVLQAANNALAEAKIVAGSKMAEVTGDLNLPGMN
jgi:DNA-binding YbaB/EbfC family protein